MKRAEVEIEGSARTCVGCREQAAPEALERFVLMGGELVYDMRRKAPGRGASVHASAACLEAALKRGAFARSFKQAVKTPPAPELVALVREGVMRRLRETLASSLRARRISVGAEATSELLRLGKAGMVLIANDAGESAQKKFAMNANRKGLLISTALDGAWLGQVSGREFVSVMGLSGASLCEQVCRDIASLEGFGAFQG